MVMFGYWSQIKYWKCRNTFFLYFRDYLSGKVFQGEELLMGKTAIVTGANSGIGKETAKDFAKRGTEIL